MKATLNFLFEQKTLSKEQAYRILLNITKGEFNNSQIASFLTVFLMRTVTVEELEGFRDALMELCLPINFSDFETIDLCGTGGDAKNTFNISTLSSFVVAAAGIKVAKHGNYGVSSVSGSSNVMEYMGYKFTNDESVLKKQLDKAGICFMHAPLFHPAMKTVAPIRKELGVKTFFNMLGPLVNPSLPKYQLTGVFSLELVRIYNYMLQKTDRRFVIVHSLDGYDEISLTDKFKMISREREQLLQPADIGMNKLRQEDLFGGDTIEESAQLFKKIISGEGTKAQNDVVAANAGMAIYCVNSHRSMEECIGLAHEMLISGKAKESFTKLVHSLSI